MLFFFFKQKTAYEMRISDWSSDVCSSDLHGHHQELRRRSTRMKIAHRGDGPVMKTVPPAKGAFSREAGVDDREERPRPAARDEAGRRGEPAREDPGPLRCDPRPFPFPDRKAGVEGKSGSVPVDLGGRRTHKK